jgi:DNA polymerase-3 subunit delta
LENSFEEYLKKHLSGISEDKDLIVVFWEKNFPKKSDKFFKLIEKNSKSQNFEKLTGAKLSQWILKEMKEVDSKSEISRQALEKLVAYAGENPILLSREIQKLVNFADGKMISEKDIETLVKTDVDSDIFKTIDMIGMNNKKEALALLHQHLKNGEDPFYLFSMFIYQFRNLLKIADLRETGSSSEYDISRITKMHPFVVRKSLSQARNLGFARLREIYRELGDIDLKVKTGKADMRLSLDKFVAEL